MTDLDLLIQYNKQFGTLHNSIHIMKMIFPWDNSLSKNNWNDFGISIEELTRNAHLLGQRFIV